MRKLAVWPLRTAVWDRLTSHASTSGYTIRKSGASTDYPYIVLRSVQFSDQSTNSNPGHEYIVQLDFWGSVAQAGEKDVAEMMDAATQALSDTGLSVTGFGEAMYMGEAAGDAATGFDRQTKEEYARGVVQYRFTVYQP